MASHRPIPSLRSKILSLSLALLASATTAFSVTETYTPFITLTPRDGSGVGTLSSYANVTPVFVEGTDAIKIPDSGVKELNLVWTFWRHKRPEAEEWPSGKNARALFTIESTADTTLNLRLTLRAAGTWTDFVSTPELTLTAGKPTHVELVLPEAPASGPVENIRIVFKSSDAIPELKITNWSVGKTTDVAAKPSAE